MLQLLSPTVALPVLVLVQDNHVEDERLQQMRYVR